MDNLEKLQDAISGHLVEIATRIPSVHEEGVEEGKKTEYDAFWGAFQDGGKRNKYIYGFAGSGWTADNFKPKYDIILSGNNNFAFNSNAARIDLAAYLESKNLKLDTSGMTSASEIFRLSAFTRLPKLDFNKAGSMYFTFRECSNLHTIDEINVTASNAYNNTFYGCTSLVEVRFNGTIGNSIDFHWSTGLSAESYKNIINHLDSTATGVTLTVPTNAPAVYDAKYGSGSWKRDTDDNINIKGWSFAYA